MKKLNLTSSMAIDADAHRHYLLAEAERLRPPALHSERRPHRTWSPLAPVRRAIGTALILAGERLRGREAASATGLVWSAPAPADNRSPKRTI